MDVYEELRLIINVEKTKYLCTGEETTAVDLKNA